MTQFEWMPTGKQAGRWTEQQSVKFAGKFLPFALFDEPFCILPAGGFGLSGSPSGLRQPQRLFGPGVGEMAQQLKDEGSLAVGVFAAICTTGRGSRRAAWR